MIKRVLNQALRYFMLMSVAMMCACRSADNGSGADGGALSEAGAETQEPAGAETQDGLTMLQLAPLQQGEELAILHTSMGDIKLRFFPNEAPKAVENFITHAKAGYYDGVIFHRVIEDFMIQGGDPQGTGTGGESIWGEGFENEFAMGLRHFRGALSMAHSALPNSNGSQFYIVQNNNLNDSYSTYFKELREKQNETLAEAEGGKSVLVKEIFPTAALDEYLENGGTPHLDFTFNENGHTVFGHVVEGMDIVDAIAAVKVEDLPMDDPGYGRPVNDVVINSISFEIYQ